ncbi:MAG: response regulator transcription factor [Bacteroidota bacterium]
MKRTIVIYGIALASLTGLLKYLEYRYIVRDMSTEIYIGIIALFFTALGIWVGLKWTKRRQPAQETADPQISTDHLLEQHNLSKREFEVLTLIAKGLSNKEIAERLYLSTNTVKTHSSNIFAKLNVKRRTQAVQKALELGLLTGNNISS